MNRWIPVLITLAACGDGPDEWTCVVEKEGVSVCLDLDAGGDALCEDDFGGTAAVVEQEPGGPYVYCDDLGYAVSCGASIDIYPYTAASEADCATAAGN